MRRLHLLLAGACLLSAVGCGEKTQQDRLPISGKVTLKGTPLDAGSIQFMPGEPGGQFGGGAVISNGAYSIPQKQGLPRGKYKVVISSGDPAQPVPEGQMPGESGPPAKERIPPEFNVKSDKLVEVAADKQNVFDFDIP